MTAPYRIRKEQGWWRVYRRNIRGGFICQASSWRGAIEWLRERYARQGR